LNKKYLLSHPAGLNDKQFKENIKILKNKPTEKRKLEKELKKMAAEIELSTQKGQVIPDDLVNEYWEKKAELEELEEQLDADTFVNGGFVAVKIDINFARFSFLTVGKDVLTSIANEKIVKGEQSNLGVVEIPNRLIGN